MIDVAFAALLATRTAGPSSVRVPQRVVISRPGLSETPLPEVLGPTSLRLDGTRGFASSRSIVSQLEEVAGRLGAAALLKINAEDEALVSRIVSENMPKATAKRLLSRSAK